jgi:hypothetical protein
MGLLAVYQQQRALHLSLPSVSLFLPDLVPPSFDGDLDQDIPRLLEQQQQQQSIDSQLDFLLTIDNLNVFNLLRAQHGQRQFHVP